VAPISQSHPYLGNPNPVLISGSFDNVGEQAPQVACVAMTADPIYMNLNLQDPTGKGLVGVQVPYAPGFNSPNIVYDASWQDLGPLNDPGTAFPFTFNGNSFNIPPYPTGGYGTPFPCGGGLWNQYNPGNTYQQICNLPDADSLPVPGVFPYNINSVWSVGPTTYANVPHSGLQGEVFLVTSSVQPGTVLPNRTNWHHYIFSWDTQQLVTDKDGVQCLRVQCAIDGGVSSLGPVFDTKLGYPGTQSFSAQYEQQSVTGFLKTDSLVDLWNITAPQDYFVGFAYCYFGVGSSFFDLTGSTMGISNLNFFISPSGQALNLGDGGSNVPLTCVWLHAGDATPAFDVAGIPPKFLYTYNRGNRPIFCYNLANGVPWRLLSSAGEGYSVLSSMPGPSYAGP
jgi:hypothetical protein